MSVHSPHKNTWSRFSFSKWKLWVPWVPPTLSAPPLILPHPIFLPWEWHVFSDHWLFFPWVLSPKLLIVQARMSPSLFLFLPSHLFPKACNTEQLAWRGKGLGWEKEKEIARITNNEWTLQVCYCKTTAIFKYAFFKIKHTGLWIVPQDLPWWASVLCEARMWMPRSSIHSWARIDKQIVSLGTILVLLADSLLARCPAEGGWPFVWIKSWLGFLIFIKGRQPDSLQIDLKCCF